MTPVMIPVHLCLLRSLKVLVCSYYGLKQESQTLLHGKVGKNKLKKEMVVSLTVEKNHPRMLMLFCRFCSRELVYCFIHLSNCWPALAVFVKLVAVILLSHS